VSPRRGAAVSAAVSAALLAGGPATPAQWTLDSNVLTRAEVNDNVTLTNDSPGTDRRVTLQGGLVAARRTESLATRVDAGLNLRLLDNIGGRDAEGHLALQQSVDGEVDSLSGGIDWTRDNTLDDRRNASDVLLGRSTRTTSSLSGSWNHRLDERWSLRSQLSDTRTTFGGNTSAAGDYAVRSGSLGIDRRWDEMTTAGVRLAHSDYSLASGSSRTKTDSLNLSAGRTLDERQKVSLGVGAYRSRSRQSASGFACPLPTNFCDAGVVAPIVVSTSFQTSRSGSQYDFSWDTTPDERTTLRLAASRELSPSATGVVRADTLALAVSRAWSPTWRGAAALTQSRTRSPAVASAAQPRLLTLDQSRTWNLSEDLSVVGGAVRRRFDEPTTRTGASSNAISISLQYQGPKIFATR